MAECGDMCLLRKDEKSEQSGALYLYIYCVRIPHAISRKSIDVRKERSRSIIAADGNADGAV